MQIYIIMQKLVTAVINASISVLVCYHHQAFLVIIHIQMHCVTGLKTHLHFDPFTCWH